METNYKEQIINELVEKNVFEAIGDAISIQDVNYKILYQNKVAIDMIGYHVGEFCYKAYEGRDNVCTDCPLVLTFRDGKVHTGERVNLTKKGELTVEITASAIKVSTGEIIAGIEVVRDITKRKQMEEKLRNSEKQYRDIVDNSLVGIYKTNLKGDILYANEALIKIFEFDSSEEMMAVSVPSLYKNTKDRDILIANLQKTGMVRNFNIEIITKTKKTKNVILSAILEEGTLSGMIMDITELKKVENDLQERIKELEDFYKMAINREVKMKQLKEENEKLKTELSKYKK